MTGHATIHFSQPGVQAPVYVVTSLSSPPWDILELHARKQEDGEDSVFERSFENIKEGTYQYKIRVGEGHWVVDESKETATDEHGNRNNVVHVRPAKDVESAESTSQASTQLSLETLQSSSKKSKDLQSDRKDSTISDVSSPAPDQHAPLADVDKVKRAVDGHPDYEKPKPDTTVKDEPSNLPKVPLIVVEKTDDNPVHGDNFGNDASSTQKAAHHVRAADATPDKVVVVGDAPDPDLKGELHAAPLLRYETEQDTQGELDAAPLLRHETAPAEDNPAQQSMDIIHEISNESTTGTDSTAHRSEDTQSSDESFQAPLLPHEVEADEDDADELSHGPLLSHETGLNGAINASSDDEDEGDELNAAPLLSHETGFSSQQKSIATSNSGYSRDEEDSETRGHPYDDSDEDFDYDDDPENDAPLLPHERDSAMNSHPDSDTGDGLSMRYQTSFGNATDTAKDLFGQSTTFRTRTNSSTLPHRMPRSDAEDENLDDPSLERFPTARANILERVASIGLQLPEDQPIEDVIHSPVASVFSTSASSVENLSTLAPVKSYASLASVPEGDSDDDDAADVESLPSPVVMNFVKGANTFAHEGSETPRTEDDNRLGYLGAELTKTPADGAADAAASKSPSKNDVVEKLSSTTSDIKNATAKIVEPIAQSLTSAETGTSTSREIDISNTDSNVRERNVTKDNDTTPSQHGSASNDTSSSTLTRSVSSHASQSLQPRQSPCTPAQTHLQTSQRPETLFQSFMRVVLGPVGRFLTACLGGRNKAGTAVLAVGVLGATWWVFG